MKHVLAVHGDNIHTEYLLFKETGEGVDRLQDGTCNHEAIGFDGAESCLHTRIKQLLERNRLKPESIANAVLGLAGADTDRQQGKLEKIVQKAGISRCLIVNDAALGVFAGTSKGYGVCSVNSDGTVVVGIDPKGRQVQVGGLGRVTGDDAGLGFYGASAVRAVYDQMFRGGSKTMLAEEIMPLMGVSYPGQMLDAISRHERFFSSVRFTQALFVCAAMDDQVALRIMTEAAGAMAASVSGCISHLRFPAEVELVLAGKVWRMPEAELLLSMFQERMEALCSKDIHYETLTLPLAAGAVMQALGGAELLAAREGMREQVEQEVLRLLQED